MKLSTIIHHLEQWAPPAYQESYDNSRLLTGDSNMEITGILVSLDCVESVVDEAVEKNCNVIVAHHPIIFGGLKSLTGKNYVERTVIKAIKNDIAIYAIHTNLDNVHTGVNRKIANLIGLDDVKILAPSFHKLMKLEVIAPKEALENIRGALFEIGVGNIGNYENGWFGTEGISGYIPKATAGPTSGKMGEASTNLEMKLEFTFPSYLQFNVLAALKKIHPYEEFDHKFISLENVNQEVGSGMIGTLSQPEKTEDFLRRIKSVFDCGVIKYTAPVKESVSSVAVCGGAGFFLLKNAISQGADIYITSDVKYHEFFDAENKIVLADIGHYESEQFTKDLIKDNLSVQFPGLKIIVGAVNTNPVSYL
jgi:dinuclear metal center YbgI/SA1388 family protein